MTIEAFEISGKKIELPAPVAQRIDINGLVIIRVYPSDQELEAYPQELLNRNVYAYDSSGQIKWQIKEAPHGGVGSDKAYMDLWLDNGKLIAGNWIGADYIVDITSGDVSQALTGVRPW